MFEVNIGKDMKFMLHMKGGGNTFMSNTNCQGIEN